LLKFILRIAINERKEFSFRPIEHRLDISRSLDRLDNIPRAISPKQLVRKNSNQGLEINILVQQSDRSKVQNLSDLGLEMLDVTKAFHDLAD
jgi:hypothetical protein